MLNGKRVFIVGRNQLLGVGLKAILQESFSPESVDVAASVDFERLDHSVDYFFVTPDAYVALQGHLQAMKQRVVILTENSIGQTADGNTRALDVTLPPSEIIDQLESIFREDESTRTSRRQESLSARELDVLKLVARGLINKHIADRLSISLHTVISHRQNITRKLGIKTVSGLTMYALLNGLISAKDIR